MKIILLRIKIFFAQKHVRIFWKTLLISFPLILGGIYIFAQYLSDPIKKTSTNIQDNFTEISSIPRTTNNNTIVESLFLIPQEIQITDDKHFWQGDALNYRYTEPNNGIPQE